MKILKVKSSTTRRSKAAQAATGGAQAICRAIEIVRLGVHMQRSGATPSRVSRAAGLKTSTVFRIMRSVSEEKLLRYDEEGRCYYVGSLAFELGLAASAEAQVQVNWRDTVERIARETGLTTYLIARADREAVCLLCIQGSTALRAMPVEVGQRLPLGLGAGSLAILASLEYEEIQPIVAAHGSKFNLLPDSKAKIPEITKRVDQTKQQGFALSSGTVASSVVGIGVASTPQQGLSQLAISVSAVTNAIDQREAKNVATLIFTAIQSHLAKTRSVRISKSPLSQQIGSHLKFLRLSRRQRTDSDLSQWLASAINQ